jgi:hypothetical protein
MGTEYVIQLDIITRSFPLADNLKSITSEAAATAVCKSWAEELI